MANTKVPVVLPQDVSSLPTSLLDRLALDNTHIETALIRSTPEEATPLVKESSQRRLLSLTDRAITGVEDIMMNGQPKERLAASLAILDRSPATQQKSLSQDAGVTLPTAAVEALIQGLGNLFNNLPRRPVAVSPDATIQDASPIEFEDVTALYTGENE